MPENSDVKVESSSTIEARNMLLTWFLTMP